MLSSYFCMKLFTFSLKHYQLFYSLQYINFLLPIYNQYQFFALVLYNFRELLQISEQAKMEKYQHFTNQQLKGMYKTHGSLLLLDVHDGLQFGIDNILWKIGNKFKGIKFIPLGCHIISYTLKDENNMFKINKFLNFSQQKLILTFKWNQKYSIFIELKGSQSQGYQQSVRNYHFDSYLGPYPQENLQFWKDNTSLLTKQILQKLDPVDKILKFQEQYTKLKQKQIEQLKIQIQNESDDNDDEIDQIEQNLQNIDIQNDDPQVKNQNQKKLKTSVTINKKFQPLSDTIYYSEIPRKLYDNPQHINKVNIDKTEILQEIIQKQWKNYINGILGETQYAFIHFLIGEDEESFSQWKKLINLIVFSERIFYDLECAKLVDRVENKRQNQIWQKSAAEYQKFALQFIVVFYNQLKQFPIDFFINELSRQNFLIDCLKRLQSYKSQKSQIKVSKKIKKRLQKLFKLLQTKFNYRIEQEQQDDEDEPMIVQQNQNYF